MNNTETRAQVAIIGAGPAGLLLARWLQLNNVDCVILEAKSREYVLSRVRAGALEQGTVDTLRLLEANQNLDQIGRVMKEAVIHLNGEPFAVPYEPYTGKNMMSYGQQSIVRDLIEICENVGVPILFDTPVSAIEDIEGKQARVLASHNGEEQGYRADYVAACDGFHGIGRKTLPAADANSFELEYGFGWLGILAEVEPDMNLLGFIHHDAGFALGSLRPPGQSRHYIQIPANTNVQDWSDEAVWDELDLRVGRRPGDGMPRGPITQKNIAWLRSFVCNKMSHGRLFLAGDAAHIVPPTGAKGLNLAVGDIRVLANALIEAIQNENFTLMEQYSDICLRRIWKTMRFSWAMTTIMHKPSQDENPFQTRMRVETMRRWVTEEAGRNDLAHGMVGVPFEV